ncbi:MAG: DUF4398 domain-containing protein [Marinicella sp.]|nr:DUF4398 domain-containing protein [Xanthomonadales bacterium]
MKYKLIIPSLVIMGCATPVLANKSDGKKAVDQAHVLIETAERNDASMNASYLLKSARDNLSKAKVHMEERDWVDAEIAAKKAQRDAEVADAKSLSIKAEKSYNDLKAAVDLLKSELDRKRSML